jgi:Matrixin
MARSLVAAIMCFGCVCQLTAHAQVNLPSNWGSPDEPCAQYDSLRNRVLGNIGVKIDVNGAWAEAFRWAFRFWNSVLVVNFHEERSLSACSIRIVSGSPEILNHAIVARSQIVGWANFRGKIAVSPGSAEEMNSAEIYAAAVHELGHMLGLTHNASRESIMYFLNVDGTEHLDCEDILELSAHHELRPATDSEIPIQAVQQKMVVVSRSEPVGGACGVVAGANAPTEAGIGMSFPKELDTARSTLPRK